MILIILLTLAAGSIADSRCPQAPVDQISYIPYDSDSTKFWQCLNGVQTLKYCPQYHHFDRVAQDCKNPNDLLKLRESLACDPDSVDFFPHPTDCSKYVWCYYGTAYVIDCEEGLWFSPSEKRCTDPVTAGCETTSSPPWTTPDDSQCVDVPDGDIVLKTCSCGCLYYWECQGKKQTLKECEFRLYFVEERQLCAGLVNCDDQTRTPFPWTTTFPPSEETKPDYNDPRCHGGLHDVYLLHPDCTKFTHCELGWGRVYDCPSDLYFDAVELKCGQSNESCFAFSTITVPTTTTTTTTTSGDPRCGSIESGLFPYPQDCSKYIECYKGDSYLMACPGDLWFNEELSQCVYQNESNCQASTTTATTIMSNEGKRCPDVGSTFLPHNQDCRKFIECYEGQSFERTCPSGLNFNQENGRCTSSKSLNCT